ncbi:MAG: His/Gly/Thr/Pro-type tRNA ligase C-terminal domain-containing protein [Alphaproteobacteria bacterium]|jgi:threonyl-tRNA synthetase
MNIFSGASTIPSKKSLHSHTFLVLGRDRRTSYLSADNLDRELDEQDAPDYIREYLAQIFRLRKPAKNHLPLLNFAIDRNIVFPGSAPGHFTLLPKGLAICNAAEMLGRSTFLSEFRGADLKVPTVFRAKTSALRVLTERFTEKSLNRMARVILDDSSCSGLEDQHYLRYAGDPEVFHMLSGKTLNTSCLPFVFFSHGDTVRKDHELSGLIRTAGFYQPCHHIIADSEVFDDAYLKAHSTTVALMNTLFPSSHAFINIDVTQEFLDANGPLIGELAAIARQPLVVKVTQRRVHYYSIQHQYMFMVSTGHFLQVGNLQLDFQNAKEVSDAGDSSFDIGVVGADGRRRAAVIIHGVSTGRNFAALTTILDLIIRNRAEGIFPRIPLVLSPYHLRIFAVHDEAVSFCLEVARACKISTRSVRAMIDDRPTTLSKKLYQSDRDWVRFQIVVGKQEIERGIVSLIDRRAAEETVVSLALGPASVAEKICDIVYAAAMRESLSEQDFKILARCDPFANIFRYSEIPTFLR